MAKIRRRFSEWTSTAKTWPLTATLMAIIVSLAFLVWWVKPGEIIWLNALVGLPLLCFAMTGLLYKLLFPSFKRNNFTNLLVHLMWTSIVAIATSFIATKTVYWEVLLAIVPVGMICSGITHGKNKMAANAYAFEILATYLYVTIFTFIGPVSENVSSAIESGSAVGTSTGTFPLTSILVFLTVPIASGCAKTIKNSVEGGAHLTKDLGARTANLLHLFSILFATALVVATATI